MSVKYIWYDNLYYGEKASKHKKKLINSIEKGKFKPNIFLVTLPVGRQSDLLEIYRYVEFKQPAYDGLNLHVVGIGNSKDEAIDIVTDIISQTHKQLGEIDVRKFLSFYEEV